MLDNACPAEWASRHADHTHGRMDVPVGSPHAACGDAVTAGESVWSVVRVSNTRS